MDKSDLDKINRAYVDGDGIDPYHTEFLPLTQKHGKSICGAPWSSFIFESTGDIKFCCMAGRGVHGDLREGDINLKNILNSEVAKKVRLNFLNGHMEERRTGKIELWTGSIDEKYCDTCWELEHHYHVPANPRVSNTDWAVSVLDDLIKHTDETGYMHEQKPVWLDIMFSNKCNFACMGCHISNSTTIGKYITAYDIRDTHRDIRESFTEDECLESKVDADGLIDYIIEHKDTIIHIHFQGGEPFMMPEVYQTMDRLIENDLHKPGGVYIWCHTNGSIRTYKGIDIVDKYLSKWEDRFRITMSHDGSGPIGEYVRYGYKDKKWIQTYNRLMDASCQVNIQHSINIFNILHQKECLEWYIENCSLDQWTGLTMNPWNDIFRFENIIVVPQLRENALQILHQCIDRCKQLGIFENGNPYYQYISSLEVKEKTITDFEKEAFVNSILKFDEMRNTDFHKTFPELKLHWDFCNA
jgi:organic radical activating enzyme